MATIKVTEKDPHLIWSDTIDKKIPAWIKVDILTYRFCRDPECGADHYEFNNGTRTHIVDGCHGKGYPDIVVLGSDTLYWDEADAWYQSRQDEELVYYYPDAACPGHYPGPYDSMGVTVYCDGSCQTERW